MNKVSALLSLLWHFGKSLLLSGWDTARIILRRPQTRSGLVRMSYGELGPATASALAALITLTPGTTCTAIDLERGELELHLLDLEQAEATQAAIAADFIRPLRCLSGETV